MAQNISLMGASYTDVPAVLLPKTGGGTARFDDTSDANATAGDIASGKTAYVNGAKVTGTASGGGSGIGTLLATSALGSFSTTSTSATNTNKTVSVSSINAYDFLIVETSVDTQVNGRHICTVGFIILTASSSASTKDGATVGSNRWNAKKSSSGTITTRQSTTAYGIYPYSCTLSNGNASIAMYIKYNNNHTGTLNGNYTTRVYGVKLVDLIGG